MHEINVTQVLGEGGFKTGLLGVYQGRNVVVKIITDEAIVIAECYKALTNISQWQVRCPAIPLMYMMKEILLLLQLKHPNILDLLGFCVRGEDIFSMSLQEHGMIAVYEYGETVDLSDMGKWPISRRLDTAIQLLDLAVYAERSPMGSLRLGDMRCSNFLMVGSRIKFSDLDYVTAEEIHCTSMATGSKRCRLNVPCVENRCRGYNAKFNLIEMNKLFLVTLLRPTRLEEETKTPDRIIKAVNTRLHSVRSELNALNVSESCNSTGIYWKLVNIRNML